ncbi:MAG: hypothetical protein L0387_03870 [Acidobacteria bacterium]|nr:hypothetical protein [Acidobacteriota bacterium]MCI0722399.1 hypothetical protein [Acidobacteriota bacterium]
MKPIRDSALERSLAADVPLGAEEDATESIPATLSKKAALQQKCEQVMESLAGFQEVYDGILAALADSHEQTLQAVRDELQQLKDSLPQLEKKSIKRLKLAGTLTALEKESQKAKLKAALRRKKDLNRMDDFALGALRALRALNQKTSPP